MKKIICLLAVLLSYIGHSQSVEPPTGVLRVNVTSPTAISITDPKPENISNLTSPNGTISFSISGGNIPYTVTWEKDGASFAPDINDFYISSTGEVTLSNLEKGIYTASITDATCITPIKVPFLLYNFLKVDHTQTNIKCFDANDGTITLEITGGSGNYEILWKDSSNKPYVVSTPTTSTANGVYKYIVTNLPPDTYKYTIKDTEIPSTTVISTPIIEYTNNITIIQPKEIFTIALAKKSQPTPGNNDGVLELTTKGGYENYEYEWKKDNVVMKPQPTINAINNNVTGLENGEYQVTVTDKGVDTGKGCPLTSEAIKLESLKVKINPPTPITCQGKTTELTAEASGGNGTINFEWYKLTDIPPITETPLSDEKESSLKNIKAGTYKAIVTDADGNKTSDTIEVSDSTNLNITAVTNTTPTKCPSNSDGTANIKINKPATNTTYKFEWYKGTDPETRVKLTDNINSTKAESTKSGLAAGSYSVTASDGFCDESFPITINPATSIVITEDLANSFKDLKCFGDKTGKIKINVSGGVTPYSYIWKKNNIDIDPKNIIDNLNPTNLEAATYTIEARDANYDENDPLKCSFTKDFTITQPIELKFTNTPTHVTCKNSSNGSIQLDIRGGTVQKKNDKPLYNITCDSHTSSTIIDIPNQKITGLSAGTWHVTVTDDKTCVIATQEIKIEEPPIPFAFGPATIIHVTENTLSNGSIKLKNIGGWGNYSYQWYTGEKVDPNKLIPNKKSDFLDKLPAGKYIAVATDKNENNPGCAITSILFEVKEPDLLTLDVTATNTKCNAGTGSINAVASGGTEISQDQSDRQYTYELFLNSISKRKIIGNTANFTGLGIGQYTVIATDSKTNITTSATTTYKNGEITTLGYVELTEPTPILITEDIVGVKKALNCFGYEDGILSVSVSGGTPFTTGAPYKYVWRKYNVLTKEYEPIGTNEPKQEGLAYGTYSVEVQDANYDITNPESCIGIKEGLVITQPLTELGFTPTPNHVSCFGESTGSIKLAISGGAYPYTIICGSGTIDNINNTISGLTKGTYFVKVTDKYGCTTEEQTIVITEPPLSLYISSKNITPSTGFELSTGKIAITADGGTPAYTYLWGGNLGDDVVKDSPTLQGVPAGNYSITVTDAKGCPISDSYTIQEPTIPVLTQKSFQSKCNGLLGQLNAVATGGATFNQNQSDRIYTYKLKNKTSGDTTTITENTASFTNIIDGDYNLTATDVGGIDSEPIAITFKQPTAITLKPSQTNIKCFENNDGTATVIADGGTPPYTYIWKEGSTTIGTNSPTIANLQQGNYSVEVRDNNYDVNDILHCMASVSFTISKPTAPLTIASHAQTDITGFNLKNGTITVNIAGGTPNYVYSWYLNNSKLKDKTTNAITDLAPGTYKVVITDANLVCEIEKTFIITEPLKLETTTTTIPVKCFGGQNGSLQITASGGIPDKDGYYTYQLFDKTKNLLETQLKVSATFNSRIAGNYYIQVTDANNIQTPLDLNLATPIVLTQPVKALTITQKSITNATCPKEPDGTISIEVTGGTVAYTYEWINEDKNTNAGTTSSISGLVAGKYKVTVTDKQSCTQTTSYVITEPEDFGFDKEKFTLTKPTTNNPNWSVNIVMKGGQNNYKYIVKSSNGAEVINKTIAGKSLFVENLPTDKYTVTVTDNTGCTKTETIDLLGNVLNVSLSQTKSIICNGDGANFEATATGGTGFITYTWFKDNIKINENGTSISGYGPGIYKVFVIDTDKIEVESNSIIVTQPDQVIITSSLATRPSCFGVKDGVINLIASGGNGSYQYSYESNKWFNFSNTTNTKITGLASGTYTFYIKDTNGCIALASQEIIIPETPVLKIINSTILPATGFGLANGSISITSGGGNGNYKYDWFKTDGTSINQTANTAINLPAGKYYGVVTDAKNCNLTSATFEITEPEKLIVIVNQPTTTISCFQDKSIQLNATVTGGASGYTYEWFNTNNLKIGTNLNSPLLGAGSYYLVVTDKNLNKATSNTIVINEPALITVNHTYQDVKCYGESNGSVTLNAVGGSNTFAYHYKDLTSNYGDWIAFTNANSSVCSGLKEGTYTFQIKDKNGDLCSNVPNITVTISQPNAVLNIIDSKTVSVPATGKGLSNGSLSVTAQGGNNGYTYKWFKNDNTDLNQTTNTAINLAAGKYYVIITDSKGCSLTSPLIEVTEPPLLETVAAIQSVILCNGNKNGSLKSTTTGGFLKSGDSYTYQWFADGNATLLATTSVLNTIGKGSYYVIVTDSNNNQAKSNSILITEPTILNNTIASDYTLCGDANEWTLIATPTGGTSPYSYIWNNGNRTSSIQNVIPGNYSVSVTDKQGCSVTKNITITAPVHLDTAEVITKPTCFEGTDATIVLTSSGGKAPYTYLWNTGETSNVLSNASAKEYSVTVTDFKGCVINKTYTIENPPKDVIDLGEDVTLCLDQSLTINATIADDKAKYSWTSTKGYISNKPIITISEAADYTLIVTNKLGCNATDTITVSSQNTEISSEFAVSSQVFTNEKFIIVDISNPIADKIEWILPAEATIVSKNNDYAELSFSKVGEYELTLNTTKGNCTATQTKSIVVIEGEYVDPDTTDLKKKFDLKIYPNPSNGVFSVDVTLDKVMPAHVKVYNLTNNTIIDSKYEEGKDQYTFNFNINGLSAGVYFVLVESQQGNQIRKIIIN